MFMVSFLSLCCRFNVMWVSRRNCPQLLTDKFIACSHFFKQ